MFKSTETLNEQMVWWRIEEMDTTMICYLVDRLYFFMVQVHNFKRLQKCR